MGYCCKTLIIYQVKEETIIVMLKTQLETNPEVLPQNVAQEKNFVLHAQIQVGDYQLPNLLHLRT